MENLKLYLPALILTLITALLAGGCASTESGEAAYPTLRQTQIDVSGPMNKYRTAEGDLTLGEKQQIDNAYARYHAAYVAALQNAQGNDNAPTPDNVKRLADALVADIDALGELKG